jgi:hypothetical protein
MSKKKLLWIAPLAIIAMVLFVFLGGEAVMHLWNWLTPPLFGWHRITFWQALGILALCRILFGGLGLGGNKRSHMRSRMSERWVSMTPEERAKFRERFLDRCGPFAQPAGESKEAK